jgi:hypothetical protein
MNIKGEGAGDIFGVRTRFKISLYHFWKLLLEQHPIPPGGRGSLYEQAVY